MFFFCFWIISMLCAMHWLGLWARLRIPPIYIPVRPLRKSEPLNIIIAYILLKAGDHGLQPILNFSQRDWLRIYLREYKKYQVCTALYCYFTLSSLHSHSLLKRTQRQTQRQLLQRPLVLKCQVPVTHGESLVEGKVPETCEKTGMKAVCMGPNGCRWNNVSR